MERTYTHLLAPNYGNNAHLLHMPTKSVPALLPSTFVLSQHATGFERREW